MGEKIVSHLYEDYARHRKVGLSLEQFASFMAFFPSLLVVASDEIVDREEWLYCKRLAKGLGNSFSEDDLSKEENDQLSMIYKEEFGYLIGNLHLWERPFLETLKKYLLVNEYAKQFVVDSLYIFADTSNGVSENKQLRIKFIKEFLFIDEQVNL